LGFVDKKTDSGWSRRLCLIGEEDYLSRRKNHAANRLRWAKNVFRLKKLYGSYIFLAKSKNPSLKFENI
jgi:hypothetical protein